MTLVLLFVFVRRLFHRSFILEYVLDLLFRFSVALTKFLYIFAFFPVFIIYFLVSCILFCGFPHFFSYLSLFISCILRELPIRCFSSFLPFHFFWQSPLASLLFLFFLILYLSLYPSFSIFLVRVFSLLFCSCFFGHVNGRCFGFAYSYRYRVQGSMFFV